MRALLLCILLVAACKDEAPPPEPERWAIAQLAYARPLDADTTAVLVKGARLRPITAADLDEKTPYEATRLIVNGRRDEPSFELPAVKTPRVALGIDPLTEMGNVLRVFTAAPALCPAFLVWNGEALGQVPLAKDCRAEEQDELVVPENQPVIVTVEPDGTVNVREPGLEEVFALADLAKAMRPTREAGASSVRLTYLPPTQLADVLRAWDMLRSIGFDDIVIASKPTT